MDTLCTVRNRYLCRRIFRPVDAFPVPTQKQSPLMAHSQESGEFPRYEAAERETPEDEEVLHPPIEALRFPLRVCAAWLSPQMKRN
jgi:hypothetical protein